MVKDYKKLYLEQRTVSLNLEMQLMSLRAQMIEAERIELDVELEEYVGKTKDKSQTDIRKA